MPRVRRSAPRRRPARRARRAAPRRQLTNVNRSLQPIPSRYICKMKYSEIVTTNTVGNVGQYIFNLNSLFDPNRTGFGHQPYGFDTLATLYNKYRVVSCGWRIQRAAGISDISPAVLVGCMPSNDLNIDFSDFSFMRENPRTKYILQNPGATALTLSGKSYLPSLMGRTNSQYMADDKYAADVLSSPAEHGVLYVQTHNATTGEALSSTIQVLLEFTVEWFDIKHIIQS